MILVNGRDEQTQPLPSDCDIDVDGAEDHHEEVLAENGDDETELGDAKNKLAGVKDENETGGVDEENETEVVDDENETEEVDDENKTGRVDENDPSKNFIKIMK